MTCWFHCFRLIIRECVRGIVSLKRHFRSGSTRRWHCLMRWAFPVHPFFRRLGFRADLVSHISRADESGEFSFLTLLLPDCGTNKVAKCRLLSYCESDLLPVREWLLLSGGFVFSLPHFSYLLQGLGITTFLIGKLTTKLTIIAWVMLLNEESFLAGRFPGKRPTRTVSVNTTFGTLQIC